MYTYHFSFLHFFASESSDNICILVNVYLESQRTRRIVNIFALRNNLIEECQSASVLHTSYCALAEAFGDCPLYIRYITVVCTEIVLRNGNINIPVRTAVFSQQVSSGDTFLRLNSANGAFLAISPFLAGCPFIFQHGRVTTTVSPIWKSLLRCSLCAE